MRRACIEPNVEDVEARAQGPIGIAFGSMKPSFVRLQSVVSDSQVLRSPGEIRRNNRGRRIHGLDLGRLVRLGGLGFSGRVGLPNVYVSFYPILPVPPDPLERTSISTVYSCTDLALEFSTLG